MICWFGPGSCSNPLSCGPSRCSHLCPKGRGSTRASFTEIFSPADKLTNWIWIVDWTLIRLIWHFTTWLEFHNKVETDSTQVYHSKFYILCCDSPQVKSYVNGMAVTSYEVPKVNTLVTISWDFFIFIYFLLSPPLAFRKVILWN